MSELTAMGEDFVVAFEQCPCYVVRVIHCQALTLLGRSMESVHSAPVADNNQQKRKIQPVALPFQFLNETKKLRKCFWELDMDAIP